MNAAVGQSYDFMPHGHCFFWIKELLFLHVGSDILIALAYFSIPFALIYLARRRPDMGFRGIFIMFAVFIMACGLTHVVNTWNIWNADYWLSGYMKAFTALVSVATAITLWKLMPKAVAWPSPALLEKANAELREEVDLRREKEIQLQEAFDNAPIGKALVALNGKWMKVNRSLCNILGYSEAELLRTDFQSITHEDDLMNDLKHVSDLINGYENSYQLEKRYKHKAGHLVWALLSVTIVRDDDQKPRYFISQILDITYRKLSEEQLHRTQAELEQRVAERTYELEQVNRELKEKNELLTRLSQTDPLTSLYNRRSLNEHLERMIHEAQRYDYEFSIMLIDIDKFKFINDNHGHLEGDRVINSVSDLLQKHLRETDIAARFGGDEFCVLLPHTSILRAPEIADNLRERIESIVFSSDDGQEFKVTCSIGVAQYDKAMGDSRNLFAVVDDALYRAKENGRNCVQLPLKQQMPS